MDSRRLNVLLIGATGVLTAAVATQGFFLLSMARKAPGGAPRAATELADASVSPLRPAVFPQVALTPAPNSAAGATGATTLQVAPPNLSMLDQSFQSAAPGTLDPFAEMRRMAALTQQLMDQQRQLMAMGPGASRFTQTVHSPRVSLRDQQNHYVVEIDGADFRHDSLNASLDGTTLTISGEQNNTAENKDATGRVTSSRRFVSRFQQTLRLPGPVESGSLQTESEGERVILRIKKSAAKASAQAQLTPATAAPESPVTKREKF